MKRNRTKIICRYDVEDKMCHGTVGNVSRDSRKCVTGQSEMCHRTVGNVSRDSRKCVTRQSEMCHGTVGNVHLSGKVQKRLLLHSRQDCGLRSSCCHPINVQYRIYTLPKEFLLPSYQRAVQNIYTA